MKELRNTRQREEVLCTVRAIKCHPTAEEVYLNVTERNPSISKGTVYRNLNLLTELGEIGKISMPGNEPDRFDYRTDDHHHAFCRVCRKLYDYELKDELCFEGNVRDKEFTVENSQLIITGICQDCLDNDKE